MSIENKIKLQFTLLITLITLLFSLMMNINIHTFEWYEWVFIISVPIITWVVCGYSLKKVKEDILNKKDIKE